MIDIHDIERAADRLRGAIMNTPCVPSQTLSQITGANIHLKFENLQFTASFKERGALNKLLLLGAAERIAGVCAMSAGNHAQGVAYHAARLGIPAAIFMPVGTPGTKVSRTRDHGADVHVTGANLDEAFEAAMRHGNERQMTFIHPFDDYDVIAGQGTLGLEILQQVAGLDAIIVPIGGGGLASGIAIAAKSINPDVRIIGVQSASYPSMHDAIKNLNPNCGDRVTIAEGIAVKNPSAITQDILSALLDQILLVDEPQIEEAVALLLSVEKTVVEGAGAAGLAAILAFPEIFKGLKVAIPLTGGNIDLRILSSVAMRALARSGQVRRFDVAMSDQPGSLSALTHVLAEAGANVLDISHDRMSLALNPKGASLDVVVEVQDRQHGDAVFQALEAAGFVVKPKEA